MNIQSVSNILYELARDGQYSGSAVRDVRIGLGYAAVLLEGGRLGLAAVLRRDMGPGCTVMKRAGTLAGAPALELLQLLVQGASPLERSLGLATANALVHPEAPTDESDALELIRLTTDDRVVMVGYFGPLVKKIEASGASLSIIEADERRPGIHDKDESRRVLEHATVGLVTATSLLNGTLEPILERLLQARHVALLGPSTPLAPAAFTGTPVNHLAGAVAADNEKIMQIISEGGGTPVMRPWLHFVNLLRKESSQGTDRCLQYSR